MPRFAVLEHDHPFLHWDLLLEQGDALRAWRLMSPPDNPGPIVAEALPDHRLIYLDYEGPISGGRGTVKQWDAGEYDALDECADQIEFRLHGSHSEMKFRLIRAGSGSWTLSHIA